MEAPLPNFAPKEKRKLHHKPDELHFWESPVKSQLHGDFAIHHLLLRAPSNTKYSVSMVQKGRMWHFANLQDLSKAGGELCVSSRAVARPAQAHKARYKVFPLHGSYSGQVLQKKLKAHPFS